MCTAEPLRECGNCRAALNETEPLQEAQIFILHKHLNTCWINLFNYSPYCSLRVLSLFINLTARVQDREAAKAYQLTSEKPKRVWGILFKSYVFTRVVLWIFWGFFCLLLLQKPTYYNIISSSPLDSTQNFSNCPVLLIKYIKVTKRVSYGSQSNSRITWDSLKTFRVDTFLQRTQGKKLKRLSQGTQQVKSGNIQTLLLRSLQALTDKINQSPKTFVYGKILSFET